MWITIGLFDLFKKKSEHLPPETYKSFLSQEEYTFILEVVIQYHEEKGWTINKIEGGEIVAELNGEEQHRHLDNIVRLLSMNEKSSWKDLIHEHFNKLKDNRTAYNFFYKDFEYAQPLLRVLIKPDDIFGDTEISQFVQRVDFPETISFLVFEFEEQFHFVDRNKTSEWNKSEGELFEIAISNIPDDEIEITEYCFSDKFTVFTFFSGDYSATLMLDLQNKADYSIGTYGSLVAIPTKGSALTHPIESKDIMTLVTTLYPMIEKFFNEDPGNITTKFFWFYEQQFEAFPIVREENGSIIRMPERLSRLLGSTAAT